MRSASNEYDAHASQTRIPAKRGDQLQAVNPRHDDVEDREIRLDDIREGEGLGARRGAMDVAEVRQPSRHQRRDLRLIIEDKENRTPHSPFGRRAG